MWKSTNTSWPIIFFIKQFADQIILNDGPYSPSLNTIRNLRNKGQIFEIETNAGMTNDAPGWRKNLPAKKGINSVQCIGEHYGYSSDHVENISVNI